MEDRHVSFVDFNTLLGLDSPVPQSFFAVYDGHGGVEAAAFAQAQLHLHVARDPAFAADPAAALQAGFLATDASFLVKAEREALGSGATACSVLLRGDQLHIGWLGDSQVLPASLSFSLSLLHLPLPFLPHICK